MVPPVKSTLLAVALLLAAAAPASAATITVDSTEDPPVTNGNCSLREAVTAANDGVAVDGCAAGVATDEGADTIVVPAGTYTLAGAAGDDSNVSGDLDLANDTTI